MCVCKTLNIWVIGSAVKLHELITGMVAKSNLSSTSNWVILQTCTFAVDNTPYLGLGAVKSDSGLRSSFQNAPEHGGFSIPLTHSSRVFEP